MKVLHKFSITPSERLESKNGDLVYGTEYPVLAVKHTEISTLFLIADSAGEFTWVNMDECFLYKIYDLPGFGRAYEYDDDEYEYDDDEEE